MDGHLDSVFEVGDGDGRDAGGAPHLARGAVQLTELIWLLQNLICTNHTRSARTDPLNPAQHGPNEGICYVCEQRTVPEIIIPPSVALVRVSPLSPAHNGPSWFLNAFERSGQIRSPAMGSNMGRRQMTGGMLKATDLTVADVEVPIWHRRRVLAMEREVLCRLEELQVTALLNTWVPALRYTQIDCCP